MWSIITPKQMTRMTRTLAGEMTAPKSCAETSCRLLAAFEAGGWGPSAGWLSRARYANNFLFFVKSQTAHLKIFFVVTHTQCNYYAAHDILFLAVHTGAPTGD